MNVGDEKTAERKKRKEMTRCGHWKKQKSTGKKGRKKKTEIRKMWMERVKWTQQTCRGECV